MSDANPKPARPDLAHLLQQLLNLRDALEETALALSDYQCTLDSEQCRVSQQQVQHMIERAKARDYSGGEGH